MNNFINPEINKEVFTCPYCKITAQHNLINRNLVATEDYNSYKNYELVSMKEEVGYVPIGVEGEKVIVKSIINSIYIALCANCLKPTIWIDNKLVSPVITSVVEPTEDMPKKVKEIYLEASQVVEISPKSAGALLRLAIQYLCEELGYEGNINTCIGKMVKDGLDSRVQEALDTIRVIGNSAVHPSEIDIDERKEDVIYLFKILNYIVRELITDKRKRDNLFNALPNGILKGIQSRDEIK